MLSNIFQKCLVRGVDPDRIKLGKYESDCRMIAYAIRTCTNQLRVLVIQTLRTGMLLSDLYMPSFVSVVWQWKMEHLCGEQRNNLILYYFNFDPIGFVILTEVEKKARGLEEIMYISILIPVRLYFWLRVTTHVPSNHVYHFSSTEPTPSSNAGTTR